MSDLGTGLDARIIHHDQDSVHTGYRGLRAILLEDAMRVSYSEHGAKGPPWIQSLRRRTKPEVGSRVLPPCSSPEMSSTSGSSCYYREPGALFDRARPSREHSYIHPLHSNPSRNSSFSFRQSALVIQRPLGWPVVEPGLGRVVFFLDVRERTDEVTFGKHRVSVLRTVIDENSPGVLLKIRREVL